MEWKAKLAGEAVDLAVLVDLLRNGDVSVVQDDSGYWLVAHSAAAEIGDVVNDLDEILDQVNGLAIVLDPQQRTVRLSGEMIETASNRSVAVARAQPAMIVSRVLMPTVETDPPSPTFRPTGPTIIRLRTDPAVRHALRLWGAHAPDFVNLYKIVEVIERDAGGIKSIAQNGWASAPELDAFGASANNHQVSGDGARHAVDRGGPPRHTMTLPEAREFVARLTRRWVSAKAGLPWV